MKHALAFAASATVGALAVGAGPAVADPPVAGNSATDSIGTVQVGPTVADPAAVVTTPAATASAGVVVTSMGSGRNTASHSIGAVQDGGGNDADRSVGAAQVNAVRVAPHANLDVGQLGVGLRLGGHVGVADGHNSARHSVGTVQAGGIELAPEVSLNVGPLASIWLGGGSSLGGERSLASATQESTSATPPKKSNTASHLPASRPSASRQVEGTAARPTSSVQGLSLPFSGLTLASFLVGALALALVGSLLRRAARAAR